MSGAKTHHRSFGFAVIYSAHREERRAGRHQWNTSDKEEKRVFHKMRKAKTRDLVSGVNDSER